MLLVMRKLQRLIWRKLRISVLQSSVDGSMEGRLDSMRLFLSEEFMLQVIETPLVPDSYYLTIEALGCRKIYDWAWPVCEKMLNAGALPDRKDRKYAIKPFACVVRSLCRIKDTEGAKKLLLKMIDEGPPPSNAVFNFVISGLSKAGEMDEVMGLVKVMESRGLRPDVYTYSVIISGYGAVECDEGEWCRTNSDEYNKMIQSLCLKAVDWRTAEKLLEEMKEKGLYLKESTKGLVRAVKELEEMELGEEVVSIEA
ncbi:Pentatricopeptide repeat-containing protein [Thalictrum thalictroides]|uniref:Pentatricopeptide repeat-containing protein n=1 Tax=Thalictrum thalictroides TaxID=46969 RepID=A0A7J6VVF9_THATH|nr:Pentatricopeptide repeat-containing protein [Thalictrum thalictroides]